MTTGRSMPWSVAEMADLGDPPGAEIREAEIADLALANRSPVAHTVSAKGVDGLPCAEIDVDVVGAEPLQASTAA